MIPIQSKNLPIQAVSSFKSRNTANNAFDHPAGVKNVRVNLETVPEVSQEGANLLTKARLWPQVVAALAVAAVVAIAGGAVATGVLTGSKAANSTMLAALTTTATTTTLVSTTAVTTSSTTRTSTTTSTASTTTISKTTTTTTRSTSTTSTTSTTTSRTTTTTTSAFPCSIVGNDTFLCNNQFTYSPSRNYAAGVLNNRFGVYIAYGYGNVSNTSLWTAPQSSTPAGTCFAGQTDRNIVVYGPTNAVLWSPNTYISGTNGIFCLQMLDSGNLVWTNSSNGIIWQTNTSG